MPERTVQAAAGRGELKDLVQPMELAAVSGGVRNLPPGLPPVAGDPAKKAQVTAAPGLFGNSRLPMWIYDLRTLAFLEVNDAALAFYGYSREEFLGMTVRQLHVPADLGANLDAALESAVPPEPKERWRHIRKNRTVAYVEVVRSLVRVAGRNACFVIAIDVSEGARSELLYRRLMDAIPSSVLLLDQELRVALANRNFLERSRQTAVGTIGKRLSEVFPEVIISEMGLEQQVRNVFRSNQPSQGQRLTYRAPGVPIRVYYCSLIPVSWGVGVDHVLFLMNDVTEQTRMGEAIRQMERHLASVVESASDIVLSTDIAGNILTWNMAAQKITGYSFEEVKGHPLFEYCVGVHSLFSGRAGRQSPGIREADLKTRNGDCRPVSWVFSQMTDDCGRTTGFVAVGRDLAEQRKFEMQLLQSLKLAALGVMAGGIAHEIRTPLAISSSAAQFLMEEGITPEFRRECAVKANSGIRRASTIIESLLRFARPPADNNRAPVDLVEVVEDALTLVASQAKVQNIEIRTHFPAGDCRIHGVPSLLEQVFMNLFLNAMNAMPGGGTLTVTGEQNSNEFQVHVADTGHGIAPDDIARIFDPFYTTAPTGKGTGLGLSICYSIVDQHKGSVSVDSRIGEGSTFTVTLPLLMAKRGCDEPVESDRSHRGR